MRAAEMKERPDFALMKQTDVQNLYYMQMPRWLFSDPRYADMSLDAKVTYTFLLNRFQLSRRRGWVNERGEVFVIFPRLALAKELRICEKRVTAAFRKLVEKRLVWEKRCGRGDANQIYLARVEPEQDPAYSCAPFLPEEPDTTKPDPNGEARTADWEVLSADSTVEKGAVSAEETGSPAASDTAAMDRKEISASSEVESANPEREIHAGLDKNPEEAIDKEQKTSHQPGGQPNSGQRTLRMEQPPVFLPPHEPQNPPVQNRQIRRCTTADSALPEPQNPPPSKKEIRKKDSSEKEVSPSVSSAHAGKIGGQGFGAETDRRTFGAESHCSAFGAERGDPPFGTRNCGYRLETQQSGTWFRTPDSGYGFGTASNPGAPGMAFCAPMRGDRLTAQREESDLAQILNACELETFDPETALAFENAIERLYYSESIRVGSAVIPQCRVRSRLWLLDGMVLREAEDKLAANLDRPVKNSTAYIMSTVYNSIAEHAGDLLVDPYLNSLRHCGEEGVSCC